MSREFFAFVLGIIYSYLIDWSLIPIKRKWQKECNFDCNNCKIWDCQYHICQSKRNKLERKLKEND